MFFPGQGYLSPRRKGRRQVPFVLPAAPAPVPNVNREHCDPHHHGDYQVIRILVVLSLSQLAVPDDKLWLSRRLPGGCVRGSLPPAPPLLPVCRPPKLSINCQYARTSRLGPSTTIGDILCLAGHRSLE